METIRFDELVTHTLRTVHVGCEIDGKSYVELEFTGGLFAKFYVTKREPYELYKKEKDNGES